MSDKFIVNEIKSYAAKRGMTLKSIAEKLSVRLNKTYTQHNLSKKLRGETIPYREILIIADILDYDIEFIDRNKK